MIPEAFSGSFDKEVVFKLILQLLAGGLRHNICFPFFLEIYNMLGALLYSIAICVT